MGEIGGAALSGLGNYMVASKQGEDLRAQAQMQKEAQEYGVNVGAQVQREGLAEKKKEFGETQAQRKKAYGETLERAGKGEEQLMTELGKSPEELEQMKKDIIAGQTETMQNTLGQTQSELAKAGIRGGQAGTQMRRISGELGSAGQRDINRLLGDEAMRRAAEKRAYLSAKGGSAFGAGTLLG